MAWPWHSRAQPDTKDSLSAWNPRRPETLAQGSPPCLASPVTSGQPLPSDTRTHRTRKFSLPISNPLPPSPNAAPQPSLWESQRPHPEASAGGLLVLSRSWAGPIPGQGMPTHPRTCRASPLLLLWVFPLCLSTRGSVKSQWRGHSPNQGCQSGKAS